MALTTRTVIPLGIIANRILLLSYILDMEKNCSVTCSSYKVSSGAAV